MSDDSQRAPVDLALDTSNHLARQLAASQAETARLREAIEEFAAGSWYDSGYRIGLEGRWDEVVALLAASQGAPGKEPSGG
jgi:hypothetical protein